MKLIYILTILFIILTIIYIRKKHISSTAIIVLCSIFILLIILQPQICIDSSIAGARLFFLKVFPSLFPFLVISNLMLYYDGVNFYSKILGNILCRPLKLSKESSFALIISFLCGYPLGAKYTCDLYEKNVIDSDTCQRLINIATNASPLFIVGSVGTAMLNNTRIAYILLAANYISCIIMGLILPYKKTNSTLTNKYFNSGNQRNIGLAIKNIIDNSISTCLSVFGYVVIFSVITHFIMRSHLFYSMVLFISQSLNVSPDLIAGFILGLVEITNGCYFISLSSANIILKSVLIGFLISFSGISIVMQVYSFTYKCRIPMKKYVLRKIYQGLICSCVIFIILFIIPKLFYIFS